MIDSLTSDNYRDFGPRYAGTFGWLLKDGKEVFVYLDKVSDDKVHFQTGSKFPFYANINSGIKFKFIPVRNGWFTANDNNVYLLSRRPARQWKRGIAPSNTEIYRLSDMRMVEVSWDILSTVFCDDFDKLNSNKEFKGRSSRLSQHFALGAHYQLYFYKSEIGSFNEDAGVFTLQTPLVAQELQDLINRNGWEFKVVVNDNN